MTILYMCTYVFKCSFVNVYICTHWHIHFHVPHATYLFQTKNKYVKEKIVNKGIDSKDNKKIVLQKLGAFHVGAEGFSLL
jgi:hypothetical protein